MNDSTFLPQAISDFYIPFIYVGNKVSVRLKNYFSRKVAKTGAEIATNIG